MNREYPLKLSIIVPVYNVEEYLERCITSLLHQDLPQEDYEIIIINDGSTDSSYEIAQRQAANNNNIVLLTQENQGLSGARNTGLKYANGKYILFVDSDDYLSDNILGKTLTIAESNSLDMCFFLTVFEHGNGRQSIGNKQFFKFNTVYEGEYLVLNGMRISTVWQNIYSADFLKDNGGAFYPRILHQDVEYNYRLYPKAKRIMFTETLGYHYCVYGESSTRTSNPMKVRKIIESDFHVAGSVGKCSKDLTYSDVIRKYYAEIANSITVSALVQLLKNAIIDKTAKIECLETAKELGVYPIHGRTNSWKTTLLAWLLNREWLLKYLIK